MMEGAGFEIVDIGINNSVEDFLEALAEHNPDILGMSALLTTTMPYMKVVIDETGGPVHPRRLHCAGRRCAAERGIRQGRGRDAYCRDAATAVDTAMNLMRARHNY